MPETKTQINNSLPPQQSPPPALPSPTPFPNALTDTPSAALRPLPPRASYAGLIVVIIFGLVATGLVIYYFIQTRNYERQQAVFQNTGTPPPKTSFPGIATYPDFEPRPLTLPGIRSRSQISVNSMPANLSFLVAPSSGSVRVEAITFNDGSTGFAMNYTIQNVTLMDTHASFLQLLDTNNWELRNGERRIDSALLDAESAAYRAKIAEITQGTNVQISVIIQIST